MEQYRAPNAHDLFKPITKDRCLEVATVVMGLTKESGKRRSHGDGRTASFQLEATTQVNCRVIFTENAGNHRDQGVYIEVKKIVEEYENGHSIEHIKEYCIPREGDPFVRELYRELDEEEDEVVHDQGKPAEDASEEEIGAYNEFVAVWTGFSSEGVFNENDVRELEMLVPRLHPAYAVMPEDNVIE